MKKGNMYEDVVTWNPLGGECPHKCSYCSTNALKRFPGVKEKYSGEIRRDIQLHKRLGGEAKTIFVCGQNDLFADSVPQNMIYDILDWCNYWNQHTYLFQTKNPNRYIEFVDVFPEKSIFCTTIETNRKYPQMGNTCLTLTRAMAMNDMVYTFGTSHTWKCQVTIEPIMDFDLEEMVWLIETCLPDQVNIGADSKRNSLPEPSKEKILALIERLEEFTIVVQKSNLARLLK